MKKLIVLSAFIVIFCMITGCSKAVTNTTTTVLTRSNTPATQVPTSIPIATSTPKPTPTPIPSGPMIDFTLKDLDGNSVTLSSFKGKNILLIFWDTSCPYCNTQLGLIPYIRSRDSNLIILAVNKGEDADYVKKVSARRNYEVTILIDPEKKVTNLYPTRYSPTNLLINKDGMVNYNVSPTGIQTEKQADEFLQMIK